jgi:fibronectin type 3 domain-containing protein
MKRIIALLFFAAISASIGSAQTIHIRTSVRAQTASTPPAATSYAVNLIWTASTSCSAAAPCTYTVYREISGSSAYALAGTTAAQATVYTDSTVIAGLAYTYEVEAVQGGVNSGPSTTASVTVPNPPLAPSGVTATAGAAGTN